MRALAAPAKATWPKTRLHNKFSSKESLMLPVQVVVKCQPRSSNRQAAPLPINKDLNKHTGSRTAKSLVRSMNTKTMTVPTNTSNNNSNSNSNSCTQCKINSWTSIIQCNAWLKRVHRGQPLARATNRTIQRKIWALAWEWEIGKVQVMMLRMNLVVLKSRKVLS